jgi:ribosomal protein S18 acetylase RimI-like enzyme
VEASRPATADDIPRIAELARVMRAELEPMRGGDLWAERDAWPEPLEDAYRALVRRDDALVVVGTIDDTPIGFGAVVVELLRSGRSLGVITDLFVEEEARSVGVGEAMVEALVAFGAARRVVGIDARALPGNRAAKNFFETHGFTARALVMHRRLHPIAE